MIREVPMYRVECDADLCVASPQDDREFYAWASPDGALDDLGDSDWFNGAGRHLCPDHRPVCAAEDCKVGLYDDEFGEFCDDHAPAEAAL